MSVESRLRRLEAARPEPVTEIIVGFADDFDPPLSPGWHPDLGVFQLEWDADEKTLPTIDI